MEFTFKYDVEAINTNVNIAVVDFKEELTEEQAERLRASFLSGKYTWLDEDKNIRDIYDEIHDTAVQLESQEEYGNLLGTEVTVTNFSYPKELQK